MEELIMAIEGVAAVLITWRTALLINAAIKETPTGKRLRTMRETEERNAERIREWEERRG